MGRSRQKGAVSIFAVLFAALLLTILTIGFIRIMLDEQEQATNNDLAQSAYDSALTGVEDAKRIIRECQNGDPVSCNALNDLATQGDCQVVNRARGIGAQPEVIISSSTGNGEAFNQAYTCVNIDMDTDDYRFAVSEGEIELIPLKSRTDIARVTVEWYSQEDAGDGVMATAPGIPGNILPRKSAWGIATPPLMRAQVISPGASIDLATFDSDAVSQTAFIKPDLMQALAGPTDVVVPMSPASRARATGNNQIDNAVDTMVCSRVYSNNGYSCKATLDLGRVINPAESANTFLRLNTVYKGSSVRVQLLAPDGSVAQFNGIQPTVDSTGRANSLFRRVEARLQMGDDFPYPNYAVDISEDICKDFSVDVNTATAGVCAP